MTEGDAGNQLCLACKASIPAGAKLCSECGTRQDWRRHLSFGSSVVALVIALISVSTLFIESIPLRWFGGASVQTSLVGATVADTGNPIVQIAIENLGFRSAIIGPAVVELSSDEVGTLEIGLYSSAHLLLEPGGQTVREYNFDDLQNDFCIPFPVPISPRFHLGNQINQRELERELEASICTLRVTSTETGGNTSVFDGNAECKILTAVARACLALEVN